MNDEPTRLTGAGTADPQAATRIGGAAAAGLQAPGEPTLGPSAPAGGAGSPPPPAEAPTVVPSAPPRSPGTAPAPLAEPPLHGIPPGTLLVNTYEVVRLLGGGGMGEVYLARHTGLGTLHAVKVIRPSMVANRQVMDLFYREAKVLRGVRHDAVVSYDGFVRDADGRDYLVMEYVDGDPLGERLRRGPLPAAEVMVLRDRLAAGLGEAHRQGAVHRDISPDNVILPGDRVGAAKLIDFGLTKLTDPGQESIIGSAFAGKFRYAAPEQFGMFGGEVDARSDIYSLGLILAAAALGRPLDMGNTFEAALRARQTVPDLAALPESLRPWLAAMLEPDPANRPASLDALVSRWPAPTQVVAAPPGRSAASTPDASARGAHGRADPGAPARPAGRPRALWIGISGGLAAVAGLGLYLMLRPLSPTPPGPGPDAPHSGGQTPARPPNGESGREPGREPGGTPASGLEALVQAGRTDEALQAAAALIAANANVPEAARTPLPAAAFLDLAGRLRAAGRPADAFVPVEALIGAGAAPPAGVLWPLALDLRAAGRLDPFFFLVRYLAGQGFGPAVFAYGEIYDPGHWSEATSPFKKPNANKAREWYQKAAALGVPEAAARLAALPSPD